jgi:uncharacterized protein (TIGR03435 family)
MFLSQTARSLARIPVVSLAMISSAFMAAAQTGPPPHSPTYDVASIRQNKNPEIRWRMSFTPDGVSAEDTALDYVIHEAYGSDPNQQWADGPAWIKDARFDIQAKFDDSAYPHPTMDQRRAMLQALLAYRFKLKIRHEQRDFPLYNLVVAKGGFKAPTAPPPTHASTVYGPMCLFVRGGRGSVTMQGCSLPDLALFLGSARAQGPEPRRTVIDQTGLTDRYNFDLHWTRVALEPDASEPPVAGPSLETAVQEQLGLKLVPTHGLLDVIVIDHIELPSEN